LAHIRGTSASKIMPLNNLKIRGFFIGNNENK